MFAGLEFSLKDQGLQNVFEVAHDGMRVCVRERVYVCSYIHIMHVYIYIYIYKHIGLGCFRGLGLQG